MNNYACKFIPIYMTKYLLKPSYDGILSQNILKIISTKYEVSASNLIVKISTSGKYVDTNPLKDLFFNLVLL